MDKKNLLIEIGCEELPAWTGEHFVQRFEPLLRELFKTNKMEVDKLMFFFTPRRLVIFVKNLPVQVPAEKKEIVGPGYEKAFDENGNPTAAALGFAKAHRVSVSSLKVKDLNGRKVVYVVKTVPPVSTLTIISNSIPVLLNKIDIPRGMRWNGSGCIFYRPVRWILAVFGEQTVRLEFAGLKSSCYTFGHRVLCSEKIRISNWKDYFDRIQKAFVILDGNIREKFILKLIEDSLEKSETFDRAPVRNIANLVEYPCVIRCRFPQIEYNLPDDVVKVLIKKANGIPIFDQGLLKKEFYVVTDGKSNEDVRTNYENLLKTRILDAQFFYDTDVSVPFDSMGENLKRIIFHQRWGSISDRVERLKKIAMDVSDFFGMDPHTKNILIRSAALCKNDLASEMVREFPELHGTMGAIYARLSGEDEEVCRVLSQYKYPVYPDDPVPDSEIACILGIIDRLDLIAGFIMAGIDVSGSEDPYGLRRCAGGFFVLVDRLGVEIDYKGVVDAVLNSYEIGQDRERARESVFRFLLQRFETYLDADNFPRGLRMGVISVDEMNFVRVRRKLEAIRDFIKKQQDADIIFVPVSRVANILKQASEKGIQISGFDSNLLEDVAEKNLAEIYQDFSRKSDEILKNKNYKEFLNLLSELKKPIDDFFDKVLVMCPQERLRNNRLSLLKKFNEIFLKFADFSYIREEDIRNVRK